MKLRLPITKDLMQEFVDEMFSCIVLYFMFAIAVTAVVFSEVIDRLFDE
jgi:hypothetical protein